jgi:hypothetical protein
MSDKSDGFRGTNKTGTARGSRARTTKQPATVDTRSRTIAPAKVKSKVPPSVVHPAAMATATTLAEGRAVRIAFLSPTVVLLVNRH